MAGAATWQARTWQARAHTAHRARPQLRGHLPSVGTEHQPGPARPGQGPTCTARARTRASRTGSSSSCRDCGRTLAESRVSAYENPPTNTAPRNSLSFARPSACPDNRVLEYSMLPCTSVATIARQDWAQLPSPTAREIGACRAAAGIGAHCATATATASAQGGAVGTRSDMATSTGSSPASQNAEICTAGVERPTAAHRLERTKATGRTGTTVTVALGHASGRVPQSAAGRRGPAWSGNGRLGRAISRSPLDPSWRMIATWRKPKLHACTLKLRSRVWRSWGALQA
jgi:hypothetical protein